LQHTLGLVPDAVREIIGPVVGLLVGERLQRMLVTMRTSMSTQEYWDTLADRTKYKKRFEKVYRHHQLDCLLTPGTGLPAHEHGKFGEVALAALYLSVFNFLDWTAGSVPVTTVNRQEEGIYKGTGFQDKYDRKGQEQMENSFGLPMGVQLSAPSGREEVVLRAMKDLEQVVKFRKKHEPKGLGDAWLSRL
jgi:Asp-tRNA(Asn)/Glu-tRNA(Gln) amidotransferase A subunit family amidase|tara:strand:+ start:75 stop:647 length:573 start_codon:yes stop_codon:yes gene_type:complete